MWFKVDDSFYSFQSTLSVRRATEQVAGACGDLVISIHALRKESDCPAGARRPCSGHFNPRSP